MPSAPYALFSVFYGKLKTAPMIGEFPYNLECRLVKTVELEADEIFIGEIMAAYSSSRYVTDGKPDLKKMKAFVLSMPERRYIALGRGLGPAWESGKVLVKEHKGKRQEGKQKK